MQNIRPLPLPETILWDMDGTLIDQTKAIVCTYSEVIEEITGKQPAPQAIRRSLGGTMASTMALFVDKTKIEEASIRFRSRFPEIMFDGLITLPGSLELIESAFKADIKQAILTNKHGETARIVSNQIGFSKFISTCIGNKDTDWSKPQRELSYHVLQMINSNAESACIIGDSPTDIETARNAKMLCYCVTTGAHNSRELLAAGADAVFDNLIDIRKAFSL